MTNPRRIRVEGRRAALLFGPLLSLPKLPPALFSWSIALGIMLTIVISLLGASSSEPFLSAIRSPELDRLTATVLLDPTFIHLITALGASLIIFITARVVTSAALSSRLIASLFPWILLFIVFFLGDLVVKPAFAVARPSDSLPEPALTTLIRSYISDARVNDGFDSMPSGFVMRQVALFYFVAWLTIPMKSRRPVKVILAVFNFLALAIISFSRVYRGAHSPLDIAAAIGVGTMLFWLVVIPPFSPIRRRFAPLGRIHSSTLAGATLIVFLSLMAFSNRGSEYIRLLTVILILLGLSYLVTGRVDLPDVKVLDRKKSLTLNVTSVPESTS